MGDINLDETGDLGSDQPLPFLKERQGKPARPALNFMFESDFRARSKNEIATEDAPTAENPHVMVLKN